MPEVKTENPEKLKQWMKDNNMEVFSLDQLCAILMKHEEMLRK